MTGIVPAIIVTLPARTIAEARPQLVEAKDAGADYAEIRLDRMDPRELDGVARLFPTPLPVVATLRSRSEGGEGPDDPRTRDRLLRELSRHPFRWVDVELARDVGVLAEVDRSGDPRLIVSSHFPTHVSAAEWRDNLRVSVPPGAIRKVVARASVGQLLRELIPSLPPPGEGPLTAMTTGASAPLLRAWSKRFGFPLVYAALPDPAGVAERPPVEPGQIPVDRLRRFLAAGGSPSLFAIVGHPVAHSRSPALHSRWMTAEGRDGLFIALDFEDDREFADSIPSLVEGGLRGLSVTHPFKAVALELADEAGPGATTCGVANVLSFGPEGSEAENTDLVAILRRLEELRDSGRWDGGPIGVLGAGGAARATLAAARSLGVPAQVWARRAAPAELLAREFAAEVVADPVESHPTLVVNATTVGRAGSGDPSGLNLAWLRPHVHTVDWVYGPDVPVIRQVAERAGGTYEDGSRLLVYQAAASYGIWWGAEPSVEAVNAAL